MRKALVSAMLVLLSTAACSPVNTSHNTPPTVVITSGPSDSLAADSARFAWLGHDADGNLAGYCYALDDSHPATWTESSAVTLRGLSYGPHSFFLQAVDDSLARSVVAVWSFVTVYASPVQPRGTDSTLEIATWNIENFPLAGSQTVSLVGQLMSELDLDIYAVEEIADTLAFKQLVAALPGYSGLYSSDDYGSSYQKTGVIYRRAVATISNVHQLFWGNESVPRPPLEMRVAAAVAGRSVSFTLIVQHLKAGTASRDRALRLAECHLLKEHIDSALAQGSESSFVAVGDWNDELSDPPAENVFQAFLDDSADYRFLTLPLAGHSEDASYIGGGLIDHVMVTSAALRSYGGGTTSTLRLDDEVPAYRNVVSDHRPVMALFALAATRRP